MGELFVNHGVTSIVALENAPKALRARSQDAHDLPRFFHPGRPAAALQRRLGGRHPPDGADLARERTRFRVVRAIQRQEFPRLCDRSRRSPQGRLHHLRPYRQRARLGPRRNGHHRAYLGLRRSRHVAGAAAFVQGRQIPDLGDLPDRLEQARCNDRGRGSPRRVPQSHAALRMGRHEQARFAAGTGGLSRPQQSGPSYIPRNVADGILGRQRQIKNFSSRYENTPWISRLPADDRKEFETGFQNVLEFTRRYVAAGGKIHAGTDTIAGGTPGPRHASRDGDAGRGRPHADAGAESGDLMAGRIAAGQERKPRHGENRLDPTRQLCRSRRRERGSAERHLQHQEDRAGDEERTLGRTGLPSGVFHARSGPPARSSRRTWRRRSARCSPIACRKDHRPCT